MSCVSGFPADAVPSDLKSLDMSDRLSATRF